MPIIETSPNASVLCAALDALQNKLAEHNRDLFEHSRQLAAIVVQSHYLIKDSARLYQENDELREKVERQATELDRMRHALAWKNSIFVPLEKQANYLASEGGKLRKYALALVSVVEDHGCDHCPHTVGCDTETLPMHDGCKLRDELHELGIEVDR